MTREERINALFGSLKDLESVLRSLHDAEHYQKNKKLRDALITHGAEELANFMDRYLGPCLHD